MNIGYDAKRAFHNTSGLGNYSRQLLNIMFNHKADYSYFLFNPKKNKKEIFDFPKVGNIHEIQPSSQLHKLIHPLWRAKAVIGECKKLGVDVYHGLSNEIPIGISKSGIRSVVSIHDLIFMRFPNLYRKADRLIYKAKFEQACKEADKIIAISEQTADDIRSFLKVKSDKIEVLYQTCQPEFSDQYNQTQLEKTREQYNLPERFLLSVGTLERRKNQELILKAMGEMDEALPLVLIGKPTSYKTTILSLAAELGLEKQVIFLSDVPTADLARCMQLAELLLYPSLFEGFGIPILEGLASGTAVISSEGSCFKEVGAEAATYVNPEKPKELAQAIAHLLKDEDERKQRIDLGFKQFENFSSDKIANRLASIYEF